MTDSITQFWLDFKKNDFISASQRFDELHEAEKQAVLAELFQKSECQRTPVMVSVLRRELDDNKTFDDFYQSWFPSKDICNPIEVGGQIFQQHFPTPVRVINAININNTKEVFSIGLSWVASKEEEQALWEYIAKARAGEDNKNEIRHDRVKEVATGELLGICRVKSDNNLGQPF